MIDLDDLEQEQSASESKSKILFCDFETNGFSASKNSALSIHLEDDDGKEFSRYYFPKEGEEYSKGAIEVNGLTEEVLLEKRGECEYPMLLTEDTEAILEFTEDATLFCAFNADFDMRWMPQEFKDLEVPVFCPMKFLKPVMQLPMKNGRKGVKNPNLKEAALFCGLEVDEEKQHDAGYDVFLLRGIFEWIRKNSNIEF